MCPWFPEHGTLDADTWGRNGVKIQQHYDEYWLVGVPVDTLSLWVFVWDSLVLCPNGKRYFPVKQLIVKEDPPHCWGSH